MDLDGRRLAQGKVALADIACAGARNERAGQRLSPYMLVVGAPVDVDDVACAMLHGLEGCGGEQPALVCGVQEGAAQRASRWAGCRGDGDGAQAGVAVGGVEGAAGARGTGSSDGEVQQEQALVAGHVKANGRSGRRAGVGSAALQTKAAATGVGDAQRIRDAGGRAPVDLRCNLKRRRRAQRQGAP